MMRMAGVNHSLSFSPLTSNWVVQQSRAQQIGLQVRPVRIGAKRVVLATDSEQQRKQTWLIPAIFGAILLSLLGVFFLYSPSKSHEVSPTPINCRQIEAEEVIAYSSTGYNLRDWKMDLTSSASLGNISQFAFVGRCGSKTIDGQILATKSNAGLRIKKLTLTNQ